MLLRSAMSGVGLGLAAHLIAQIFEPPFVSTLRLHIFGFVGFTALLWKGQGLALLHSLAAVVTLSTTYVLTLSSSIVVYRLYLHRLCKYPGETIHKLSILSWLQLDWQGKRAIHLQEMHAKYGPVIRIGPRELSIADYEAAKVIHSATKGPWYPAQSASPAVASLQSETNPSKHAARHRRWDSALSGNVIRDWSRSVIPVVKQLLNKLGDASKSGVEVDIAEYLVKFSLDSASILAVGTSCDFLDQQEIPPMVESLGEGIRLLDTLGHSPYLLEAVRLIPSSTREFDSWVSSAVQAGIEGNIDSARKTSLVDFLRESGHPSEQLVPDASLFITHGSKMMSKTLTNCIRELAKQPLLCQRLEKEIHDTFGDNKADDYARLRDECPFLNACISETLRMWPPVPTGPQRETSSQGLRISEKLHIPAKVIISLPTYTLHRDATNFSSPDDFDPTRWLPSETKAANHCLSAYSPFGHGSMGCVGRESALTQCRLVLAGLFRSFVISQGEKSTSHAAPCLVKLAAK